MPPPSKAIDPFAILEDIMQREGGYVNHPKDPGGPTNYGVTLTTLRRTKPNATIQDLKKLTKGEAKRIYWNQYVRPFAPVNDEKLLGLLADSAVHHGDTRVQKWLQAALETTVDGRLGPESWAAYQKADREKVYERVLQQRRQLIEALGKTPKGKHFYGGWDERLKGFEDDGSGDN